MKLHEYLGKEIRVHEGKISPFPTADFIGIEIELENVELERHATNRMPVAVAAPAGWQYHIDDSLRNQGLEFVFDGPAAGSVAATRLESLITWVKTHKLKPEASDRTSVHIHVDAGDCTMNQLFKWLLIYTVYEPLLFEVYAPTRKKSNFCVPIYDSYATRSTIGFLKKSFPAFYKELGKYRGQHRYSAVNLDALHKFGSLEFRHLAGTYKPKPIIDWTTALLQLKAWAKNESTDASEIFHGPSKYYCQQMTSNIFSDEVAENMFTLPNFTDLYLEGARTAQEIFLDDKIPEIPSVLLPRIEEVRQQKNGKKIQMVKEQVDRLTTNPSMDNIPTVQEFLQPPHDDLREVLVGFSDGLDEETPTRQARAQAREASVRERLTPRTRNLNITFGGGGGGTARNIDVESRTATTTTARLPNAADAWFAAPLGTEAENSFVRDLLRQSEEERVRTRREQERAQALEALNFARRAVRRNRGPENL
jgi:hypothetical protein